MSIFGPFLLLWQVEKAYAQGKTGHCLLASRIQFGLRVVHCLQQPLLASPEIKAFIILLISTKPSGQCYGKLKLFSERIQELQTSFFLLDKNLVVSFYQYKIR